MRAEWKAENGRYSFMAGGIGWRDRVFALEANGTALSSDKDYRFEDGAMVSRFTRERIVVTRRTDLTIACRRSIENVTAQPIRIRDIRDFTGTTPLVLGGSPGDWFLFHAEAIHEWGKYRICLHELARPPAQTPLKEGAPRAVFGATGWQPYTGICFARKGGGALVEGVLSQDRFYRYWAPRPDGAVEALFGMFGIDEKILAPGETLDCEEVYLEIQPRFDPADPFAAYNRALREVIAFHGQEIGHYKDLIWGSWNDGIFTRVTDELVRERSGGCLGAAGRGPAR
ncbi:MAG: hypothetical protein JXR37_18925 [Kiritimatiellae bacterium]|nr:hypothetical protein [Kiritimatiellia bacterium]